MNRRDTFRRRMAAASHNGNGFSLIEILVVLVLLLIGILAILRLFPGGFLTIVRTGEMTAAQSLVDQQSNSYRNLASIPTGFDAGLPNSNGDIVHINGIQPDDLTDASAADLTNIYTLYNFQPVPGYSPYYFSNINKLRYVIGETVRLPVSGISTTGQAHGTVYTLQFGPVFNMFGTDPNTPNNNAKDSIQVYGPNMTAVQQDSTAVTGANLAAVLPDGTYYAIDYANNKIAFYPRVGANRIAAYRQFKFTATTYRPDPITGLPITDRTNTTVETNFTIIVPDDTTGNTPPLPVWQPIKLTDCAGNPINGAVNIWPGTEQVNRKFRLVTTNSGGDPLAPNSQFTSDPYEYYWYSPQQTDSQNNVLNVNTGTLFFNPLAHIVNPGDTSVTTTDPADRMTLTATGNLVVRVDYLTFDNHVIRDDRSIPTSVPFALHTSLPYIATNGDLLADQNNYSGLFTESAAGSTPDVIVLNMATGDVIGTVQNNVFTGPVPGTLDPKTGQLVLGDPNITQNKGKPLGQDVIDAGLAGMSVRLLYRTQKEYGMQVQQATAQYQPVTSPACLDYRSFYIGNAATGGQTRRIYFDVGQAGKTINIGEYYTGPTTNTNDRHTNGTFQITDNAANFEAINGTLYAWVDLGSALNSTATGRAVNDVQGASLKSRVIWIGSTQLNQVPNGQGSVTTVVVKRWRKVDNDTVLQTTNQ